MTTLPINSAISEKLVGCLYKKYYLAIKTNELQLDTTTLVSLTTIKIIK